jgi:hypothetical protein
MDSGKPLGTIHYVAWKVARTDIKPQKVGATKKKEQDIGDNAKMVDELTGCVTGMYIDSEDSSEGEYKEETVEE